MGSVGTANYFNAQLNTLQKSDYYDNAYQNPMPMSDNADRANRLYMELPVSVKPTVEEISPDKLKASQDFIYKNALINNKSKGNPVVVNYRGEYIVLDGHHRVLRSLWNKQNKIKIDVYNV